MGKSKWIGGLLVALVLVGGGCVGGDFSISEKDPKAEADASGVYAEVQKVGGDKTIVRPSDIHASGQGKDGLAAIETVEFVSVEAAIEEGYLFDELYGVSVLDEGVQKFYPHQIMAWHEVLVDDINGQKVTISYSPLVDMAGAYVGEYGVSGLLWNNDSLIYDTDTKTLWSKILGRAVYGDLAGDELQAVPHDVVSWGVWRKAYPEGVVLSSNTGVARRYDLSPYGTYMRTRSILFPLNNVIVPALEPKAVVSGVEVDGVTKAYQEGPIVEFAQRVKNDYVGGKQIVVWMDASNILRAHETQGNVFETVSNLGLVNDAEESWELNEAGDLVYEDQVLKNIEPKTMYWLAWSAMYPESELYAYVLNKGFVDGPYELEDGEGDPGADDTTSIQIDDSFGADSIQIN